jgi:hypothetical protein
VSHRLNIDGRDHSRPPAGETASTGSNVKRVVTVFTYIALHARELDLMKSRTPPPVTAS